MTKEALSKRLSDLQCSALTILQGAADSHSRSFRFAAELASLGNLCDD